MRTTLSALVPQAPPVAASAWGAFLCAMRGLCPEPQCPAAQKRWVLLLLWWHWIVGAKATAFGWFTPSARSAGSEHEEAASARCGSFGSLRWPRGFCSLTPWARLCLQVCNLPAWRLRTTSEAPNQELGNTDCGWGDTRCAIIHQPTGCTHAPLSTHHVPSASGTCLSPPHAPCWWRLQSSVVLLWRSGWAAEKVSE